MRGYLTIKNAIITMFTVSIYYKSILDGISMSARIFGTVAILVGLMYCLQTADRSFLDSRKRCKNRESESNRKDRRSV